MPTKAEQSPIPHLTFSLRRPQDILPKEHAEIEALYRGVYEALGIYVGDDKYRLLTLPTTTDIATLDQDGETVAAANLNGKRIGVIASKNNKRSVKRGLIGQLISKIQHEIIGPWVTVSLDSHAHGMIAAVTSAGSSLRLVNDPQEIVKLLESTNLEGTRDYIFHEMEDTFLSRRLAKIGIYQDRFTALSKTNSLHGVDYSQVVFQTKTPL